MRNRQGVQVSEWQRQYFIKSKIYFCQRPLQRQRQRETVEYCPTDIEVCKPQQVQFTKDSDIVHKRTSFWGRFKSYIIRAIVPIHLRPITDTKADEADLLYTWGAIPFRTRVPFVVELDTPYVLTLYSLNWFNLMRPILRFLLLRKNCRGIVCISEACRKTLGRELGEAVANKARVVYPYMKDNRALRKPRNDDRAIFLFVSTQFYLKGGRETLRAFERLASEYPAAHLMVVSNVPNEILAQYKKCTWVTFVEANMDKSELFDRFYKFADVFVLPSYQDSFGLVYLEAVSFGLPVVATRSYAIPEMIHHEQNGFLVEPPFSYYEDDGRAQRANWNKDLAARVLSEQYPAIENELYEIFKKLMDEKLRSSMGGKSRELFEQKFNNNRRNADFLEVVNKK